MTQNVTMSRCEGFARFAAVSSTGMIQPACHITYASHKVGTAVRKMNSASDERRPKRSESQPPRMQKGAKITVE